VVFTLSSIRGVGSSEADVGAAPERPWLSLFKDFDDSQPIILAGGWSDGTRIELQLSRVVDKKELRNLTYLIRTRTQVQDSAPSSGRSPLVLRLKYERGGKPGEYYLLVGERGPQVFPLPPAPPYEVRFLPALYRYDSRAEAEMYGQLLLEGRQHAVLDALRILQPKLRDLTVIPRGDQTMLYADVWRPYPRTPRCRA
jgi:hypothetical protein